MGSLNNMLDSLGASDIPEQLASLVPATKSEPLNLTDNLNLSSLEERALNLLGSGCNSESVAAALGVSAGRISQLLSVKVFADKVAELRYTSLQKHNQRDGAYDSIEDKLLEKLDRAMPLMVRPDTILKAISVINGAKRRGSSAPEQITSKQTLVTLVMPTIIAKKFTVNTNNQVIQAGDQSLLTMPSGNLKKQMEQILEHRESDIIHEELSHVSSKQEST
jgi:hypothetical protein